MDRKLYPALVLVAALVAAGCDNEVENATQPAPTPTMITETFEGTINVNGAMTHQFNTAVAGRVTATLKEVTPDATVPTGFVLGTWNGIACQTSLATDAALQNHQLIGDVSGAGALCVRIHDTGRLTQPLSYKVEVVHP